MNYKAIIFLLNILLLASCANNSPQTQANVSIDSIAIYSGVEKLSSQILENPSNAELYYDRGLKYYNTQIMDRASIDFNDACTLDSSNALYFFMAARANYALNKTIKAANCYEKAIALKPDFVEAQIKLADLYYITKEHQKSINLANNIIAQDKNNSYAYHLRAINFKDLGDTVRAISNFQKAIELDNNDYDSHMLLATLFLAQGNRIALEYINAAIRIRPNAADAFFARATFWQQQKQYKMALIDYKKVIKLNPDYFQCYYNVGYINFETNFLKEAIVNFDLCVRMANDYLPAYYMRGLCYESLKDFDNARLNYDFVLKYNPDYELAKLGMKRIKGKK